MTPLELLAELSPEILKSRLSELEAEIKALRVLLRSIRARQGAKKRIEQSSDTGLLEGRHSG